MLAIDYGTRKVGLAMTDPLQIAAHRLPVHVQSDILRISVPGAVDVLEDAVGVGPEAHGNLDAGRVSPVARGVGAGGLTISGPDSAAGCAAPAIRTCRRARSPVVALLGGALGGRIPGALGR